MLAAFYRGIVRCFVQEVKASNRVPAFGWSSPPDVDPGVAPQLVHLPSHTHAELGRESLAAEKPPEGQAAGEAGHRNRECGLDALETTDGLG
jgi:hypothetical protein